MDHIWVRNSIISSHAKKEHIISYWMEQGLVFRWTTTMIKHYRREEGKPIVRRNAVMSAFHCMMPKTIMIKKRSQGNVNHEAWKKASYRQTKQANIMLGQIKVEGLHIEIDDLPTPHTTTHPFSPRSPVNRLSLLTKFILSKWVGTSPTISYKYDSLEILLKITTQPQPILPPKHTPPISNTANKPVSVWELLKCTC